jgi:hypothetical protein
MLIKTVMHPTDKTTTTAAGKITAGEVWHV